MNYGELKQAILDDTHCPELSTKVAQFVRECEGMIRRDLTGYILRTTITDTDRVTAGEGIYNLPDRSLIIRDLKLQGRQGDDIDRVAPGHIRRLDTSADVLQYCEHGDGTIEFRGVPGTAEVFDLLYFGTPAPFSADTDENDLLTDHESLYMSGSKVFLYMYTQDRELMQDQATLFNSIVDDLNQQVARKIGGASIAPSYNFAGGSSY
jgi:hypothetical protein